MKTAPHAGGRVLLLLLACIICLSALVFFRQEVKTPATEAPEEQPEAGDEGMKIGGFTPGEPIGSNDPEASFTEGQVQDQANATIMVYIVGSDLESKGGAASADIVEMVNSGFDFGNNHLLVMTGGSKAWRKSTGISADALTIYELSRGKITEVSSSALASMGDPDTLSSFLNYCYTYYPAESYGLILWDHGGGPMMGYGNDELFRDNLSVAELVKGLKDSPFGPTNKLSFLGFDACLMASAEVAWSLRDYADYMIASEEVIPGNGWDYQFLAQLNGGPLDGAEAGRAIIDSYRDYYEKYLAGQAMLERLTLSCIDLTQADQMETVLNDLFAEMSYDLAAGKYSEIAQIRQSALPFAKYTTDSDLDLIDLADLVEKLSAEHPEQAEYLRTVLEDMVVYSWSPLSRAHGLTLYYPFDNKEYYSAAWGKLYPSFGFAPNYTQFLQDFTEELLGGSSAGWRGMALPELEEETDEYYIQLTPEQAADYLDGSYYLLRKLSDGVYTICGVRQDVVLDEQGRLHAEFGGDSLYVTDDEGNTFTTLYYIYSETGNQDFHVAATLHTDPFTQDEEFRLRNVWFLVSLDGVGDSVPLITAIERQGGGSEVASGKEECTITDFPYVYFLLLETHETRDEDGTLLPVSEWETGISDMFSSYDTDTNWRAELRPLGDDGYEYFIQLVARDTYGQEYGSELIPVKLTETGEQNREEMFDNMYFPLPENESPAPQVGDLHDLYYYTNTTSYRPLEIQETLILDDPSGMKLSLVGAVDFISAVTEEKKDLILLFRLDDESRYFDMFGLDYDPDEGYVVSWGDTKIEVYFYQTEYISPLQKGGSYYYEMHIPYESMPEGMDTVTCAFRMWQREWATQLNVYYRSEPVQIPLP